MGLQTRDDLLVLFLEGGKAHLGPGNGLSEGGSVRSIILATLARHAVGGDELGCDQFDAVAVLSEQALPNGGSGAGLYTDHARGNWQSAAAAVRGLPGV